MASTLSEDEFQRLQGQLLELKTSNYSFEDKIKKQENEINFWKNKCDSLEKQSLNPLSFARNLTRNSSKDRELIERLSKDNVALQQKIETQEHDFRVTNDTLRQEIAILLSGEEKLKNEVQLLKENLPVNECDAQSVVANQSSQLSFSVLAEKEELENKVASLTEQLTDLMREKETLNTRLEDVLKREERLAKVENDLREALALCESRKEIIDEMKSHIEDLKNENSSTFNDLKLKHESVIAALESRVKQLETEKETLSHAVESQRQLEQKLKNADSLCKSLEEELSGLSCELEKCKSDNKVKIDTLYEQNAKEINQILESYSKEREELTCVIDGLKEEVNNKDDVIRELQQQINDIIEERKIHEKKGLMMVKELKRQLHLERKRAEKLQEKLQEALNERSAAVTVDVQPKSQNGNDSSSVGSWSFMSSRENGGTLSVNSSSDSKQASPVRTVEEISVASAVANGSQLELENAQLVSRLTEVQQEKWTLEERVNQLEVSNAKLLEELSQRKQLIEYYCIEGRNDPLPHHSSQVEKLTVKRVFDFIKAKGDENLKDINRRLVRMLEETLTKNMHLEQNLELLSSENMSLKAQLPIVE